jgi:hypothetical protein
MLSSVAIKGPERVLTVPAMPGSGVPAGRGARVVRARILPDGQCVQFGPEQYGGPAAIGQDARHSRTADASVDREVIFLQFPGDTLGGAVLLVG